MEQLFCSCEQRQQWNLSKQEFNGHWWNHSRNHMPKCWFICSLDYALLYWYCFKDSYFFFSFYCLYACLFVTAFTSIHPFVYRFIIYLNILGRLSVSKIEELPDDNWEDDITVNMTAPFMVIKQLLGSMKEKGNE